MARYIDAEHLLSEIQELKKSPWFTDCTNEMARVSRKEAVEIVEALCINREPTADVRENVRGKWIKGGEQPYFRKHFDIVVCSICNKRGEHRWNFCPNCGADMRGDTE